MSKEVTIQELISCAKVAYKEGRLPVRKKCCGKCAFSPNSLERIDPYGWESASEKWAEGSLFVCHEGLPSHQQQVEGEPLQVCAGWKAMEGKPLSEWLKLAYSDGRDPDPKFLSGYSYMPDEDQWEGLEHHWCKPCKKYNTCVIFHEAFTGMRGLEPSQWIYDEDGKPQCIERIM